MQTNCKACDGLISDETPDAKFCSEICAREYNIIMQQVNKEMPKQKSQNTAMVISLNTIKKTVDKYKRYIISNVTLGEYQSSEMFGKFIETNNLMIVKIPDTELNSSVIKKSIV